MRIQKGILYFTVGLMIVFLLLLFSTAVTAQQLPPPPANLTLCWTIPTEKESGAPLALSEIAGYELIGSCLDLPMEVLDSEQECITVPIDTSLSCDWQISAVDNTGDRSEPSNAVTVEFDAPKAPVLRRVSF